MPLTPKNTALNDAVNYLSYRDHTKLELKQKLSKKGHELPDIQAALVQLEQKKLLHEDRYTENFVQSKRNKGFGPERIRLELSAKGIADSMIAEHLSLADNDWSQDARKVWQKHFRGKHPTDYAEKAKQLRFLQYRGFNQEQLRHLFTDEEM